MRAESMAPFERGSKRVLWIIRPGIAFGQRIDALIFSNGISEVDVRFSTGNCGLSEHHVRRRCPWLWETDARKQLPWE